MRSTTHEPLKKSRHRWVIGLMMMLVVGGGVVSFVLVSGGKKPVEEEIVIVDLSLPPPPPPPPPPVEEEETLPEPSDEVAEPTEIAEADAPEEMTETSGEDLDLGLDVGDLASGGTGSFTIGVSGGRGRRGMGGGGGGDALLGADLDAPPTPVSKVQPTYPSALLSKGIGGKVVISCTVDENGKVVATSVKKSAGHPDLDKAALNALSKWKFKPAQKAGRNVRAVCLVPYNFEVKKS